MVICEAPNTITWQLILKIVNDNKRERKDGRRGEWVIEGGFKARGRIFLIMQQFSNVKMEVRSNMCNKMTIIESELGGRTDLLEWGPLSNRGWMHVHPLHALEAAHEDTSNNSNVKKHLLQLSFVFQDFRCLYLCFSCNCY